MTELKHRDVKDILIACVVAVSVYPEAVSAAKNNDLFLCLIGSKQ